MKPRQIVTVDHATDCRIREWIFPQYKYLRRNRLGRRDQRTESPFVVFRCNDHDCPAQMIMPWHEVAEAIHLNEQKEAQK